MPLLGNAKLNGLLNDALRNIFAPVVMGDDYPSETYRMLNNKELPEFGEYRTLRLVSEAWNTLGQGALH